MSLKNERCGLGKKKTKMITIISSSASGNIVKEKYSHPISNCSSFTCSFEQVNEERVLELELENRKLARTLEALRNEYELAQKNLQICKNVPDMPSDEIIPYFYNQDYSTVDSLTTVTGGKWIIKVWLIGLGPPNEELRLYPLGKNNISRLDISPIKKIDFNIKQEDSARIIGKAIGNTKMYRGKPIIEFNKFINKDGNVVDFRDFNLPVLFESTM